MKRLHTRRDFLQMSGAGVAAALGLHRAATAQQAAPAGRLPNFIVMMADDIGAREIGCYGHPVHQTPHLDQLARTGVQFATCYSTPICHPTRFMIMTGQYGHHNGVYHFANRRGGPKPTDPAEQISNHVTFAQVLKQRGYATAHTGKWQLTGKIPKLVHEAGFDEYCMWAYKHNLPQGVEHTGGWEGKPGKKTCRYWHPSIVKNGEYMAAKPDDYGPDVFANFAIDFAKRHRDRPFFIYYPMALTHSPYYTTPDTTQSRDDHFRHKKDNWQANVEYTDKIVGRIVKALDGLGIRESTILFFTGDNGTGGNGKGRPTELGARVPGIWNCPGIVKAQGVTGELSDLTDVLPTLADFAGAALPKDRPIDGKSLAPLLKGETSTGPREWIYAYLADRRVLRDRRWLLEDNSPKRPGRFYDCGDSRNGEGYQDVTDSEAPEVVAARKRFDEILADKTVPDLPDAPTSRRRGKRRKKSPHAGQEIKPGGAWSNDYLRQAELWTVVFNAPVVRASDKALHLEVREGQARGVAMIPMTFTLPAGARKVRVSLTASSPDVKPFLKLLGDADGSGRVRLVQESALKATGETVCALDAKITARLGQGWAVKLGITAPEGSYIEVESVEFTTD